MTTRELNEFRTYTYTRAHEREARKTERKREIKRNRESECLAKRQKKET